MNGTATPWGWPSITETGVNAWMQAHAGMLILASLVVLAFATNGSKK